MENRVEECGDIEIYCSSCNKQLGVIVITRPTTKIKNKIIFKCPFCGDRSFNKEVDGSIYVSGTDKVKILKTDTNVIEKPDIMIQELIIYTKK